VREKFKHRGTEAQGHRGTEAQRHRGTEAQRHRGYRGAVRKINEIDNSSDIPDTHKKLNTKT